MRVQMNTLLTVEYEVQIKRLACLHQSGEGYQSIQSDINAALMHLSGKIGLDPGDRVATWSELHTSLKRSLLISADPHWINVIRFALSRIKSYKQNALVSRSGKRTAHT